MKHGRKLVSLLLTLCLLAGFAAVPAPARAAEEPAPGTFAALQALLDAGGTVTLDRDYTAGEGEGQLTVPAGVTATLDLNGHTVDRGLGQAETGVADGRVVTVKGSLRLTDGAGGGKLTGGNAVAVGDTLVVQGSGGGVFVASGGTFTMSGGTVSGNTASGNGGGVYVEYKGTFTMTGGTVSGNTASANGGGGVFVGGTFTMSGGTVSGNTATGAGGGVYIFRGVFNMSGTASITGNTASGNFGGGVYVDGFDAEFTMTGGEIGGNAASLGGGVYVAGGTFKISGSPVVAGNTAGSAANDVYLPNDKTVTVAGELGSGALIGVTTKTAPAEETPVTFAQGGGEPAHTLTAADCARFFSDDAAYGVVFDNGQAQLSNVWTEVDGWIRLHDALAAGGLIRLTADVTAGPNSQELTVPTGVTVTLDLNGHVIDRNLESASQFGHAIRVLGSLTLTDSRPGFEGTEGDPRKDVACTDHLDTTESVTVMGGVITGGFNCPSGGGVFVGSGGTFTMLDGKIVGNRVDAVEGVSSPSKSGGGVSVAAGGTFTMNGGLIAGNGAAADGGGVSVGGAFTMNGGAILMNGGTVENKNKAPTGRGGGVFVDISGTFTMNGGSVSGNAASYGGGGVCLYYDTNVGKTSAFTMNGGEISGNATCRATSGPYGGGGVYNYGGTFTMNGGAISGNAATGNFLTGPLDDVGGGVYVRSGYYSAATFTMNGGEISCNTAAESGGGVYVSGYNDAKKSTFTMTGGTVSKNSANSAGGVYVDGESVFNVSGGSVVSGNLAGETASNVSLAEGVAVTVAGALTGGASIGVSAQAGDTVAAAAEGYTLTDADAERFRCDGDAALTGILRGDTVVLAEPLQLWVGGTDIVAAGGTVNGAEVEGVTGTASYDEASNTLTLTNYVYEGPGHEVTADWFTMRAAIWCNSDLTIVGTGKLTVSGSAEADSSAIYCAGALTVAGAGTELTVTGGGSTAVNGLSSGVYADSLTVTDGASLEAESGAATYVYGVYCGAGGVTVTGADTELTATGCDATGQNGESAGVQCMSVTVTGGATLDAEACDASLRSYGVWCGGEVNVGNGSSMSALGGAASGTSGKSCGIRCKNSVTVGEEGASLTGDAEEPDAAELYAFADTATSVSYGVYCEAGGMTAVNAAMMIGGGMSGGMSGGVCCEDGDVAFRGALCSVFVTGDKAEHNWGVRGKNVTVGAGASVLAHGCMLGGSGEVPNDGSVTTDSRGVWADKLTVGDSGMLQAVGAMAKAEGGKSYGVYADAVTVDGSALIAAADDAAAMSCGVWCDGMTVSGGNVAAVGNAASAENGKSWGVHCGESVLTVQEGVEEATFSGNTKAVYGCVVNEIKGSGCADAAGSGALTEIGTAVFEDARELNWKYVRFPVVTAAVSGSVEKGDLTAAVIAPAGSLLIAAAYEDGRLAEARTFALTGAMNNDAYSFEGFAQTEGRTYRLLLVDADYAPLCKAWNSESRG